MTKFEKLVAEIMMDAEKDGEPVTKEEAEEMAKMEMGAKEQRHYEKSTAPKKERKTRERKIDEDKANLFGEVVAMLQNCNLEILETKTETEVKFRYNKNDYTIKLIKHRQKK